MERQFNQPSGSKAAIDAEWAALPADMRAMLEPYREPSTEFAAISIVVADDRCFIDVALIMAASKGDKKAARDFIMAEALAMWEAWGERLADR